MEETKFDIVNIESGKEIIIGLKMTFKEVQKFFETYPDLIDKEEDIIVRRSDKKNFEKEK